MKAEVVTGVVVLMIVFSGAPGLALIVACGAALVIWLARKS